MKENIKELREKFLGFGRQEFADWLEKGLIEIYQGQAQNDSAKISGSFEGMGGEILSKESVTEGLAQIYESDVSKSGKLLYRRAIGDVLRESAPEMAISTPAINDLIYLIGRIEAREPLESFMLVIERDGVDREKILYPMMGVLILLSPCEEVYKTTKELVNSSHFDNGYLFEALNILTECKPSNTPAILDEFSPRLKNLRSECHKIGGNEWTTYREAETEFSSNILNRVFRDRKKKVNKILNELS